LQNLLFVPQIVKAVSETRKQKRLLRYRPLRPGVAGQLMFI
jgi:hypothetical protein